MKAINNYIEALKKIDFSEASEISLRTAFENFLNEFIKENDLPEFNVLHEGKRIGSFGVPDFRISINNSMLGYIETKKTDENLDKIIKSEQIKKYRELSQNLIITNYIEFVWLKGEMIHRETLCYLSDFENKKFKLDSGKVEKVEKLLLNFFSQAPEKISLPKDLAFALAIRCKNLKDFIYDELKRQDEQNIVQGKLLELYNAFKDNIFAELTISEFSDAFAQMLIYGFFLAGLNADSKKISLRDAKYFIPSSFQLIKELIMFLEELEQPEYNETKWILDETLSIINNIEWYDLKQNLSFNKKVIDSENIESDPYIYFYETFLATYDYNLRKAKGVYYTPPQVVNFIVRAINDILKEKFELSNGFGDRNKVTVLDFATGTGTFLLEIFKIVLKNIPTESPEKRKMLIKDHILQNLYGFEYLIAPYTIAHLKLSQFLKENGYQFACKDRLQVYLTNTLEPVDRQIKVLFMPQLTKETQTAQEIKEKPILVITGNPPYSGHSKNNSDWIKNEIKKYNFVDGKPLGEKNPKWLQDDYVKFIRFAQDKMDKVEQGIVGIITNHSFLDNPTFRGMRQSMMNTFDQLYFIDLHGNAKKKEKTPEGNKDQNVFDIEQGVCISILIKQKGLKKGIFHTDFWGDRTTKFYLCANNSLQTIDFNNLSPNSPFYLFVPQNKNVRKEFENYWLITDIFEKYSLGVFTHRDHFLIDFEKEKLYTRIKDFTTKKEAQQVQETFQINDTRDWKIDTALKQMKNEYIKIEKIFYRPFDKRFVCYNQPMFDRGTSRSDLFSGFLEPNSNISIIVGRAGQNVAKGLWNLSSISDSITDTNIFYRGGGTVFPLYRYNGNGNVENTSYLFKEDDKKDNFTEKFRTFIQNYYTSITQPVKDKTKLKNEIKLLNGIIKNSQTIINDMIKIGMDEISIHSEEQRIEETKKLLEQKQIELTTTNKSENHFIPSPEQILGYIYAILYSPTYRKKYADFLKIDFPRIPFTNNLEVFKKVSELGNELIEKHLMKEPFPFNELPELGNYPIAGDNIVLKPEFKIIQVDNKIHQRLYINKTQYFEIVPEEVYNFYVGGYQVLDKYLKDRKGRSIENELYHFTEIVKTIYFSIKQIELIDKETKEWI